MTTAHGQSLMVPGQYLEPGQMLVSENKTFVLVYQKDGNLVLYQLSDTTKTPTWASGTDGSSPGRAHFETGGDLVIRDAWGMEVWRSRSRRSPGPDQTLRLQDDGNLVAYEVKPDAATTAADAYWASDTWDHFNTYALLIGVEEYPNFKDRELLAGRNDVLAMWQVCRRLGYKPENIRVCTSPVITLEQIVEAEVALALSKEKNRGKSQAEVRAMVKSKLDNTPLNLTEATYASIFEGMVWLGKNVGEPFLNQKGTMVPAILAYSGHGAVVNGELALCPSDVEKASNGCGLDKAVPFSIFEKTLCAFDTSSTPGRSPLKYLTVLLDCCFAGAASAGDNTAPQSSNRVTSLTTGTAPQAITPMQPTLGQRIFCAARPDEQGYQALLGGRWHGAFTWALTQALEQWKVENKSGVYSYSSISHTELLFRARMLLEALSFRQHPMLLDAIGNTPVFWSDGARVDSEQYSRDDLQLPVQRPYTSAEPDVERAGIQLDPNQYSVVYDIALLNASQQILASAAAISVAPGKTVLAFEGNLRLPAQTYSGWEWWWIPASFVNNLASATYVKFTPTNCVDDAAATAALTKAGVTVGAQAAKTAPANPNWTPMTSPNTGFFRQNGTSWTGIQIMKKDAATSVTWCTTNNRDTFLVSRDSATIFASQTPPKGLSWHTTG